MFLQTMLELLLELQLALVFASNVTIPMDKNT